MARYCIVVIHLSGTPVCEAGTSSPSSGIFFSMSIVSLETIRPSALRPNEYWRRRSECSRRVDLDCRHDRRDEFEEDNEVEVDAHALDLLFAVQRHGRVLA